ncbi:hypothetical protein BC629DRAFT_1441911 [Irpex lacteus]|nr:hypothetical protein BC629DRAFT_1441911 [Irpex lacteus]
MMENNQADNLRTNDSRPVNATPARNIAAVSKSDRFKYMPTIISIPLNAGLTPPETQISVLSKRVERLSYVRGSLNDEYNSLSWICKMDNHIITEVLSHFYNNVTAPIRYGPGGLKTGGTYYGNPYKWITVTQVCRKLRRIALNTKQLWGTIWITRNSECVSETPLGEGLMHHSTYTFSVYDASFPE